jgi:hypothetical protein
MSILFYNYQLSSPCLTPTKLEMIQIVKVKILRDSSLSREEIIKQLLS